VKASSELRCAVIFRRIAVCFPGTTLARLERANSPQSCWPCRGTQKGLRSRRQRTTRRCAVSSGRTRVSSRTCLATWVSAGHAFILLGPVARFLLLANERRVQVDGYRPQSASVSAHWFSQDISPLPPASFANEGLMFAMCDVYLVLSHGLPCDMAVDVAQE
jgi:hypothetical protein